MFDERVATSSLAALPASTTVCLAGRIVAQSERGALLRDQSGIARLAVATGQVLNALVVVRGVWDGHSVEVEHFEVLQTAKGETRELSALARQDNLKQTRLIARARIMRVLRAFFDERGFLEVETPLVVPSPGLDVHLDAMSVQTQAGERYLITSPEYQMKRLLAGGLERIYQVAKCFRKDEIGERHQPEFSMLEWYRGYADVAAVMRDTEELVAAIATAISGTPVLQTARGPVDVAPPWPRMTVREAFARFAKVDLHTVLPDEALFYRLMVEQVEPALADFGALFLCDYPTSMASLARKKPGDPSVAERFEAYVAGIELCNGFGELTDPLEQRVRLLADQAERAQRGLPIYPIDERFLTALEEGIPPSGGNALGLDRLVMLALGAAHIEDVMAVPASRL
ncbi:MAG: Translation elongation factor [Myxococcaceae bacterium]|nr:Translation elongation factor [Myxococcaceae bacterium]